MFEGLTTGGILGLFAAVALVLFRANRNENVASEQYRDQMKEQGKTIKTQGEMIRTQGNQIQALTLSNFRCEYRMTAAIAAMRNAGIEIPRELNGDIP